MQTPPFLFETRRSKGVWVCVFHLNIISWSGEMAQELLNRAGMTPINRPLPTPPTSSDTDTSDIAFMLSRKEAQEDEEAVCDSAAHHDKNKENEQNEVVHETSLCINKSVECDDESYDLIHHVNNKKKGHHTGKYSTAYEEDRNARINTFNKRKKTLLARVSEFLFYD